MRAEIDPPSEPPACPACGLVLPPGLPASACPRCLLAAGMAASTGAAEAATEIASDVPAPGAADELAGGAVIDRHRIGQRIGRYKLLEKIGEGGFGIVYLAEQREPVKRKVALKVLKPGMDTRVVVARFEAERQALALMDHPNIAQVYDGGATDSGRPYFVMELVKGIPLTKYCDDHQLTTRQRLDLFLDVLAAVQHAHQKGIIHRDLKPSNILVSPHDGSPVIKVIDFGIAKAITMELTSRTLFTGLGQMIGTPQYMSPEQAETNALDVDTRSDIYSLGVVLYELLTGRTPIDAKSLREAGYAEIQRLIREEEPPKPSTRISTLGAELPDIARHRRAEPSRLTKQIRGDLDWIVMKALEKDRQRRYETANAFAADLRRHLADEPVTAAAPSAAYRLRKFARRNKTAFRAATVVLLAFISATGISVWQGVQARAAERLATQRLSDVEAVSTYLIEIFRSTDPTRDGRKITVAETLDRAVKRLDTDFKDQPDRRARLERVLGSTYYGLGLIREAIPLQERARDYYLVTFGRQHFSTLDSMTELANSYSGAGRHHEALEMRQELLALYRKLKGGEHSGTLGAMSNLALSYHDANRRDEALKLREEVLALRRKTLGPEHIDTLAAMHNLLNSYDDAERRDEVLQGREELLALRRKISGPDHPDTLGAMTNLALSYGDAARWDDALKLHDEVLTLSRRMFGPEHPRTLMGRVSLAISHRSGGHMDEALRMFEEILPLCRTVLGLEHPDTLRVMRQLADCYADAGRRDEALRLREEVLEISRRLNGPEHFYTLGALGDVCNSYSDAGRWAEALKLLEEALPLFRKVNGPEHPQTLAAMHNLASQYSHAGRWDEALKLEEEVVPLFRKVNGPEHPQTLGAMHNLAEFYSESGRLDEALNLREEVLTLHRRILAPEHPGTLRAMRGLALSYDDADRGDEAIALQEEVLTLCRKVRGPAHPDTSDAMYDLASSYVEAGRLDEALKLREQAVAIDLEAFGPEHPHTLTSMGGLAQSFFDAGRREEALKLEEDVLMRFRKVNGPEHPKTLRAMLNFAVSCANSGRRDEGIRLHEELVTIMRRVLPAGHPELAVALANLAEIYEKDGRGTEAEALHNELANNADSSPPAPAPVPNPGGAAEDASGPRKPSVSGTLVAPDSEWRWLHPTDGKDPAENNPGFHTAFHLSDFDDSNWKTGQDSDAPDGGFGYGLTFNGVNIGKPEAIANRRTAYFRHSFKTDKAHAGLELRCRRDDGIIVYLDGKEVLRDNMETGPDAYSLAAKAPVGRGDDTVVQRFRIPVPLAAGSHTLAISVHNIAQPSTDLRLAGVTLVAVEPAAEGPGP